MNERNRGLNVGSLAVGAGLILLGGLLLLGQMLGRALDIDLARVAWPFFVIVPGLLLLAFSFGAGEGPGQGLAIAGSIVTAVGTLLFFQNLTGLWASWAYAWALVAPTSVGLGLILWGLVKGRGESIQAGLRLAGIGLVLFLAFGFFFEAIIGLSGFGIGRIGSLCWPILLIGLGILVLAGSLLLGRKKE